MTHKIPVICQYSSDKTKILVETAIYRVSKTHNFVQVALNPSVFNTARLSPKKHSEVIGERLGQSTFCQSVKILKTFKIRMIIVLRVGGGGERRSPPPPIFDYHYL